MNDKETLEVLLIECFSINMFGDLAWRFTGGASLREVLSHEMYNMVEKIYTNLVSKKLN